MEQFVLYIVIGIIWFVIRSITGNNKKKQASPPPRPRSNPSQGSRPTASSGGGSAPKTFEDLLKQLNEQMEGTSAPSTSTAQRSRPTPPPPPPPKPQYPTYETLETLESYDDTVESTYEQAIENANKFKTIDEAVSIDEEIVKRRFKEFELDQEETSYYARLFRNPDNLRDAIIMKEILDRKY